MSQISNVLLQIPAASINGNALSGNAEILHTQMRQRTLQKFPVSWEKFRVWDAFHTNAVGTAATDDLALTTGAFTASGAGARISAGDCKNLGATTRRVAFFVTVPDNYDDGETIQLRFRAGMVTTVASVSCTIDAEAFTLSTGATVASDLVTTSATSINSLSVTEYDFTLDAANINPGDLLEVRLTIACNDSGTGTAVTPTVYAVSLLCDTRG
jgi:hypothetical protein